MRSSDGFRVIARKDGPRVRLYSRPGNDLSRHFPLVVETLARLRSRSCIIDGGAVACDDNGLASFDLVRHHRANDRVFLYAFDLIELNGDDLRRQGEAASRRGGRVEGRRSGRNHRLRNGRI
jgi:bifunctional non-homologous end joining protein LigD